MAYSFDFKNNFSGGEHDAIAVDNIKQSEVVTMVNLDPDTSGGLLQRPGTVDVYTTLTDKRKDRIIEFEFLTGTTRSLKRLELIDGKLIDPDTPDAGQTYKILWSTGLSTFLDYEVFNNKLYILTGTDYLVYNGTTITSVTCTDAGSMIADIKKCKYLIKKGDRMIFSGHSENPNYVLYSQRLRPDYVKDASAADAINPIVALSDDGDVVTGLEIFQDKIIIFKRRSIFSISGVDPMTQWVFKKLDSHTGTVSHRTVDKMGNYLVFLGFDKSVYRLFTSDSGDVAVQDISTNKDMTKILLNIDPHLSSVHSVFHEGKYLLSVSTGTDEKLNDTIFVFNFSIWQKNGGQECWYRYKGINSSDMLVAYDGTLYFAKTTGGKTVKLSASAVTDSGALIECILEPHSFDGSSEDKQFSMHIKKYKAGYVYFRQFAAETTKMDVYNKVDYDDDYGAVRTLSADESAVFDEGTFDVSRFDFNDVALTKFTIGKRGRKCIIRLTTTPNTTNSKVAIYGIGVRYKLKKLK